MQLLLQTNGLQQSLASDITPVRCDICSTLITWWMCDKSMPESKASIVSSFQATQTRHVFHGMRSSRLWLNECTVGRHRCVWIVNDKCVNGAVIYFTNDKTKEKATISHSWFQFLDIMTYLALVQHLSSLLCINFHKHRFKDTIRSCWRTIFTLRFT